MNRQMKELTVQQMKEMLLYVADSVIDSKKLLTEVDSKIGDGDHGIGMENGFKAVKSSLQEKDFDSVKALFQDVGMAMLGSMGGASGVIFSSVFLGGTKNISETDKVDFPMFSQMFSDSLDAVKKRGKAQVGDKTMVDSFEPACKALKESAQKGQSFKEGLAAAEKAAEQGVENTKKYVAKFGRSKSLMERSIGYQDAGATSMWIIFRSMREWFEKNCKE